MLDGRNNRFFFPREQMFFLMQIIFIVLPSNMAAVQNLYRSKIKTMKSNSKLKAYAHLQQCKGEMLKRLVTIDPIG